MRGCPGCGAAPTPNAAARRARSRPAPSCRSGLRPGWPGCCPMLVRTRHLPLLLARGSPRDQDPLSAATHRIKALQALLSRHVAAHLGMPGSILQRERSTQKPGQCPRARTAGSGCPKPAGQSSSTAYRTAVHVRHAAYKATAQRDGRAALLRCTGRRRASAGKVARRSVVLPYRGDMPARKRPAPRTP